MIVEAILLLTAIAGIWFYEPTPEWAMAAFYLFLAVMVISSIFSFLSRAKNKDIKD